VLASVSIDQRISRRRQSQALYTDSIALVRLGRNHHERDCKRAQGCKITKKVQFWNFPASAGKRIQSEAHGAVKSLSPPWYRPGKVVVKLPARHSAGEVELIFTTVVEAR
jgi:hypothetical protein